MNEEIMNERLLEVSNALHFIYKELKRLNEVQEERLVLDNLRQEREIDKEARSWMRKENHNE